MKSLFFLLFSALVLSGCSKPSADRIFSPAHPSLEVYIVSNAGSGQGTVQPDFQHHVVPLWNLTVNEGDAAYSATIEYKGTQNEKDYYWVTLTAPPKAVGVPAPAEIAYDGLQIELWSDSRERIGIRPYSPNTKAAGSTVGAHLTEKQVFALATPALPLSGGESYRARLTGGIWEVYTEPNGKKAESWTVVKIRDADGKILGTETRL